MTRSGVKDLTSEIATPQRLIKVIHHGKMIGYFLPAPPGWDPDDEGTRRAVEKLGEAVERAQQESGLDEEGLVLALTGADS